MSVSPLKIDPGRWMRRANFQLYFQNVGERLQQSLYETGGLNPAIAKVMKIARALVMPPGSNRGERRGGRQRGTLNKKTVLRNAALAAAASDPNISPLDFLLGVMRDPHLSTDLRIKVALAAVPFVHAKPGNAPSRLRVTQGIETPPRREMGDVEVARRLASLLELGAEKVDKAEADLAAGRITPEQFKKIMGYGEPEHTVSGSAANPLDEQAQGSAMLGDPMSGDHA